ncbi:MAG TPA: uroporphyrinogen-III C-methyltransferase, partial [Pusillimonas sp.]|uniref:uroporphyrinogen-III C-methyltransferase n=1 Tax=Pusillimonas sp. TaxID=3040095 RepID=UPI002B56151D
MTDTKPDNTSDSGSATQAKKTNNPQAAAKPGTLPTKSSRTARWVAALLILLLIIAALAGVVWYQQRTMQERDNQLSSQAQQSAQSAQAATSQAAQALSLAQAQASQLQQLQADLAETQQHVQSLEQALQTLTDSGTDIALVNDIDQLVSIAHQQLLLGGNVSNALIALETAQARLARANRPGLASLQQAINGDLARLRAVSTIDINRLSSRIDELGRLIDAAPLLIPDEAAPALAESAASTQRTSPPPAAQAIDPKASWWQRNFTSASNWAGHAWWTVKQDLAGLVSVRRVDDASALLMSPEQAAGLRDKLRLRLMTAQLALLMKQPDVWQTETKAVVQSLQSRYDINTVEGH